MQAVDEGEIEAAAGSLTEIVTVVAGWETVTNASAAVLGRSRETDQAYRDGYLIRTAHSSVGPVSALEAALEEALAGRVHVLENRTASADVIQEYTVLPHSILAVVESGSDADVTRAIETHRGMGVGTTVGQRGAAPDETALRAINDGTVTWNSQDYTGLDLTGTTTPAERAAALTLHLATDPVPPVIASIDARYVVQFGWRPDRAPVFGSGDG